MLSTLKQIHAIRAEGREERIERAKRFTANYQQAAVEVRRGTPYNALPRDVREFLETCSESAFQAFEAMVQGKRRSDAAR